MILAAFPTWLKPGFYPRVKIIEEYEQTRFDLLPLFTCVALYPLLVFRDVGVGPVDEELGPGGEDLLRHVAALAVADAARSRVVAAEAAAADLAGHENTFPHSSFKKPQFEDMQFSKPLARNKVMDLLEIGAKLVDIAFCFHDLI